MYEAVILHDIITTIIIEFKKKVPKYSKFILKKINCKNNEEYWVAKKSEF